MESKRLEVKVGLFVLVGLVLLAVLLIQFSKGTSIFRGTYALRLHTTNVSGLKLRASVLVSGVIVGSVSDIQLAPDGKSVTIILKIYKNVKIYRDAQFVIDAAGFLGDQFVAVIPTQNKGEVLADGADVDCEPPFDLQQVARSASGFIQRVDDTVKKIETSVSQLQATVLNERSMTNLAITISNLRTVSDQAVVSVDDIHGLIATNGEQINLAVSNVVFFSQQLSELAGDARGIIATNGVAISGAVSNLQDTTVTLKAIADDMHAGKGLAGTLFENDQMAGNVQATINNLTIATSNLNKLGLWHILWRQDAPPHTNGPAK